MRPVGGLGHGDGRRQVRAKGGAAAINRADALPLAAARRAADLQVSHGLTAAGRQLWPNSHGLTAAAPMDNPYWVESWLTTPVTADLQPDRVRRDVRAADDPAMPGRRGRRRAGEAMHAAVHTAKTHGRVHRPCIGWLDALHTALALCLHCLSWPRHCPLPIVSPLPFAAKTLPLRCGVNSN